MAPAMTGTASPSPFPPSPPRAAHALFGLPPSGLVDPHPGARQFSPLIPGSEALEEVAPGSLAGMVMLAAGGTPERRYDLALMLRALAPGAPFTVLAPKDMGGSRLAAELTGFGCTFTESAKRHHRICAGTRPDQPAGAEAALALDAALTEGAPRLLPDLGLWSQPGLFSWNRLDRGTALLLEALPVLSGRGADLGCGIGVLAHGVLASAKVSRLHLLDVDRRAVDTARRNVGDPRVEVFWTDMRGGLPFDGLDFAVMNPPFHDAGTEDKTLGRLFIERAAGALRPGGQLWMVANRHLPYEAVLKPLFRRATTVVERHGFKVITAQK